MKKIRTLLGIACIPVPFVCALIAKDRLMLPAYFLLIVGATLNRLALHSNGGKMPVKGYEGFAGDSTHCLMTEASRFQRLCDVYNVPWGVCSVGDLILYGSILALVIGTVLHLWRLR
jgi:hypothetical protein